MGHSISKYIVIGLFKYPEEKSYLKALIGRFWEKMAMGGGLVTLQFFFWSLEKDTSTFSFPLE